MILVGSACEIRCRIDDHFAAVGKMVDIGSSEKSNECYCFDHQRKAGEAGSSSPAIPCPKPFYGVRTRFTTLVTGDLVAVTCRLWVVNTAAVVMLNEAWVAP